MKKTLSISLAAALAFSAVPAAFAETTTADNTVKTTDKSADHKKSEVKAGTSTTVTAETTNESTTEESVTTGKAASMVKEAVKTKKQLIELRQQLKHATEITEELKQTYEKLVSSLEKTADLAQAIEVQKELLERTYKLGERKSFEKLGELYNKANEKGIKAFVNGEEPEFDQAPFIQGGRALVPIRAISSALKADVKWDAKTRSVVITKGDTSITLYLDKKEALVGGKSVQLDTVPVLKKGRVFLPLRFVSEQLHANVNYQAKGNIVIIEEKEEQEERAENKTADTTAAATSGSTASSDTTAAATSGSNASSYTTAQ